MRVAPLLLLLACGPGGQESGNRDLAAPDPCLDHAARLEAANRDLADAHLHRALGVARALVACAPQPATRLEAMALGELGIDAEAIAAWRRLAAGPGATAADRRAAAAAIAELEKRPPAERDATAEEQATALALYRDGVNLRLLKNYPGALRQLRRAYTLWPHPLTIVQIAATHRAAGDPRAARLATERALAIAESTRKARASPRVSSGNVGFVGYLGVSGDGRRLMSVDALGKLRVWDAASGRQALVIDLFFDKGDTTQVDDLVSELGFHPDGSMVAVAGRNGEVGIWALDSGRELRRIPAEEDADHVTFVGGGRLAVSGKNGVVLFPVTGGPAQSLPGGARGDRTGVARLAADPTGRILAAAWERRLLVWDLHGSAPPAELVLPASATNLAVDAAGERIAVAAGSDLHLYDWRGGRVVYDWKSDSWIDQMAFGSIGLLATTSRGRVVFWDGPRKVHEVATGGHESNAFAWAPDGAHILTSGDDWSLQLWEVATGTRTRSITGLAALPLRTALTPDERTLVTSDVGGLITVRDLDTGAVTRMLRGHETPVVGLALSPDGRIVASGAIELADKESQLKLWDLASGKQLAALDEEIEDLVFSRDGRRLYSARSPLGGGGDVAVWDVTGAAPVRLEAESGELSSMRAIAASPTDDLVAAADDGDVGLLPSNGAKRDPVVLQRRGKDKVHALAFSADGRRLVAAGEGGVEVWDVATRRHLRQIILEGPPAVAATFTPGGQLVIARFDGGLVAHDLSGGQARPLVGHDALTISLACNRDGLLFSASMDGTVRIWHPGRGELLATLVSAPDGRWLVVAADGRVDGSPGDEGGASLLSWQVGDVQLPGYVAWQRQHTPGLLRSILSGRGR